MIKLLLATLTGGISTIFTNWKQYLLAGLLAAFGIQSIYLMYVKYQNARKEHQIAELMHEKETLNSQLNEVQTKFELQKSISQKYVALVQKSKEVEKVADKNIATAVETLEKLPLNLTSDCVKIINKRLKCELENFENTAVACNENLVKQ
jgi:hypothetical protein